MPWKLKDNIPPRPQSVEDMIEGDLEEVTELTISDKNLEYLPDDIDRLVNVTEINAWQNHLRVLPSCLGRLAKLKVLHLSNNQFEAFPEPILSVASLERLTLVSNPLVEVPAGIGTLRNLKSLWLTGTAVADLPLAISDLPLEGLGISVWTPQVAAILGRLGQLRKLGLVRLDADSVEAALAITSSRLESLILADNGLTRAPSALATMDLAELSMFNHRLTFPDVQHMRRLTHLYLSSCGLAVVPPWVGTMTSLRSLFLANNLLTDLPRQLADLGDDLELFLFGNPLAPPLGDLAKRGTKPLFDYLRSRPDDPAEPPPEDDPDAVARDLPEQRPAPVAARVVEGRLELAGLPPPAEAARQELAAMHADVLDWAHQTTDRIGSNHPLVFGMLKRLLMVLGGRVEEMQVLSLAFAADRLEQVLDAYFEDGRDPLSAEQRGMVKALLGNIRLMVNWTAEWQDYKRKVNDGAPPSGAAKLINILLGGLANGLERDCTAATPELAKALQDVSATAEGEPTPVHVQGAADSLHNALSPMARFLLRVPEKDRAEIRKTVVQMATRAAVYGGGLGIVAATYFAGFGPKLLELAQLLPLEFGWLKSVMAALKTVL